MKAIVLAEGCSRRLADGRPDSPMRIGDTTLVERSLAGLQKAGITQAVVVVDHPHHMLEEVLGARFDARYFRIVLNPDAARGSGSSLRCAADALAGDVLLLEADSFHHEAVIARMAALWLDNALAMGRDRNHGGAARIRLRGAYVHSLVFDPQDTKSDGDWVGITRLSSSAAAALRHALRTTGPSDHGPTHYTDYVCRLVERFRFRAISIDDLP